MAHDVLSTNTWDAAIAFEPTNEQIAIECARWLYSKAGADWDAGDRVTVGDLRVALGYETRIFPLRAGAALGRFAEDFRPVLPGWPVSDEGSRFLVLHASVIHKGDKTRAFVGQLLAEEALRAMGVGRSARACSILREVGHLLACRGAGIELKRDETIRDAEYWNRVIDQDEAIARKRQPGVWRRIDRDARRSDKRGRHSEGTERA